MRCSTPTRNTHAPITSITSITHTTSRPQGFAYIEFLETDAVENALLLDASEIRGRAIKVRMCMSG